MAEEKTIRWYPTSMQLKDPQSTERAFREVLRMFYDLQDSHFDLHKKVNASGSQSAKPVNTAADQRLLGLPVQPADTTQLADGTVLTYVAAERVFKFL